MATTPTSGTDPLPGTTDSTLGGGGTTDNTLGYGSNPGATSGAMSSGGTADQLAGAGASSAAGFGGGTAGAASAAGGGMGATGGAGGALGGSIPSKDELKNKAGEYANQAKDIAADYAAQAKDKAAAGAHEAADAVRNIADKLGETQAAPVADYARRAADGIERFSSSLQNKSLDELLTDARDFVRARPGVAIGAAAVVGFAIARFLKAQPDPYATYEAGHDDRRA